MEKHKFQINEHICVGNNSPTVLNVLIGANDIGQQQYELKKLDVLNNSDLPISIITDLSLYNNPSQEIWRQVVKDGKFVAGTVPVYQAVSINKTISPTRLIDIIYEQAENGVKLMTIHPTANYELLETSKSRLVPITSRGGAAVVMDMLVRGSKDNVYFQILDKIKEIALSHGVTISIGSTFRSANIHDAMDNTYLLELEKQVDIANYFYKSGVKTVVETPGHASPQIITSICDTLNNSCPYPIMPLGPMPTDCAFEQDDFAAAIGAVLMGIHDCADILSVVTMEEHMGGIPTTESLLSAIKKYSVAKHIIDIYKINDMKMDEQVSMERSQNSSCIFGSLKKCNRCKNLCPLNLSETLKSDLLDME